MGNFTLNIPIIYLLVAGIILSCGLVNILRSKITSTKKRYLFYTYFIMMIFVVTASDQGKHLVIIGYKEIHLYPTNKTFRMKTLHCDLHQSISECLENDSIKEIVHL